MTSIMYTGRTDFRAFAILIAAINTATKTDLQTALKTCEEQYRDPSAHNGSKPVWRDMATLLRKQIRRF